MRPATFSAPRFARAQASGLQINSGRLWETLHETCRWGAANRYGEKPTDTGMSRLTLSDDDARVRRWFATEIEKLGGTLTVDQMGNMFARRAGKLGSPAPMTAMGSHLDTQPRGGRYDDILGVVAALEVLRTLHETGFKTNYDVGVVNWTNEEGARFPKSMSSSGVWAGAIPVENAWNLSDIHDPSVTLRSELERHGFLGETACSSDPNTGYPLGAHFELHIEQGPILQETSRSLGAVIGAQGYRWLTSTVTGRDAHTGTTPFSARQDPLLAASKMIVASNAAAQRHGALASTGVIRIPSDASTNTVVSQVAFTLDIRHPEDDVVHTVQKECLDEFHRIASEDGKGVGFTWTLDTDSPAVKFHEDAVGAVKCAAELRVGTNKWMEITSGAGHDSVYANRHCPTAMIFVPCQDGVSHHPTEYCKPEDCALGTQALLESKSGIMSSRRPIYFNPEAASARCSFSPVDGLEQFHKSLPNYSPSPLVPLPELAAELGVRAVFVKHESNRFGLPSFKVLGASWGCCRAVASYLGLPPTVSLGELSAKAKTAHISLLTATEGNHGRAVAFVARLLSLDAHVFVRKSMDNNTRGFIQGEGAKVHIVDGDYDKAVAEATVAANQTDGGLLIQDTAFDGYEDVPSWIVEGYSTMMNEIDSQLAEQHLQSTVLISPVGVGSLAQAAALHCKSRSSPVSMVTVEPDSAPCLIASLEAGNLVSVPTFSTIMNGMNCGTVSSIAWPHLKRLVDAAVTISCFESHSAVQYLASRSVAAGPCGGASLAALRRLASAEEKRSLLTSKSVVVLLCTEGPRKYGVPLDVSPDDAVTLTQMLTSIDSSSPTLSQGSGAGENEIVKYLEAWNQHRGIEHHRVETVPGRPSIVGRLRGTGTGRSLMFNGHIDTVSLCSYEKDPLSGKLGEKNGRPVIFGRGSLDMKGGLAAALASISTTIADGCIPRGEIIVAAVADEEDTSQGTQDILAAGWRADAAVIPEPTNAAIVTAHKGFLWVELDILGVAAHGSLPSEGVDAILHAGSFLHALEVYQKQPPTDQILGQASLHCGLISGGEEPSSYPTKCTITVEFRTVPSQTEESILHDLGVILEGIAREKPEFRYTQPQVTLSRPTQNLAFDHPLAQRTANIAETILGARPPIQGKAFWCDAALLDKAGIPTIVFGPAGEGLHAKEEWVEVESLKQMEAIYAKLIQEFCL
ncbi:hypothetical protein UA08_08709 [Talaromyces atroroseus]|uniref:Peptidase M20 dimerisation domain-containing protein n=1 Tax=Talaromyces atroroseus TaxID=1441469 RepID=A0A225AGA8_TALAT|nr:hypothetical protein UA08_08709 [Talaromyces atroroseus]OKL56038.1 hypothetical protein UA08_08709 [Talaromyces atroroseus]